MIYAIIRRSDSETYKDRGIEVCRSEIAVWETQGDAQLFIDGNRGAYKGYAVVGVIADWTDDTHSINCMPYRMLTSSSQIVLLDGVDYGEGEEENVYTGSYSLSSLFKKLDYDNDYGNVTNHAMQLVIKLIEEKEEETRSNVIKRGRQ